MDNLQICRACLITNVKMYNMQELTISRAYLELTGISNLAYFSYICYECLAWLRKCSNFRSKCFRAHNLLTHVVIDQDIQRDRREKCLESSLVSVSFDVIEWIPSDQAEPLIIDFKEEEMTVTKPDVIKDETEVQTQNLLHINEQYEDYSQYEAFYESPVEEYKGRLKPVCPPKKKKKRKLKKKIKEVDSDTFDDIDNEPLTKLRKRKTTVKKTEKVKKQKFNEKNYEGFVVVKLTIEEAMQELELRKESNSYKYCTHKCNMCFRAFEALKAYENHMKKHSSEFGNHECQFCHLRFMQKREYWKHVNSTHVRKFMCKTCSYTCFASSQALAHRNLHEGKTYDCEMCGQSFSFRNTLIMHRRIKHPTDCVCALCGSTFAAEKGLKAHQYLVHKQEENEQNGPICAECDVHFATETAWKRHLVLSSRHQVSHGCEVCGDTFPDEPSLKLHARKHARKQRTIPIPTACKICGKKLNHIQYKDHMITQHPESEDSKRLLKENNCVCEFCGKRFKKPCFLSYHARKHTGERPYECDVCKKKFSFPATLYSHKKSHSDERRVKCDQCDKTFKSKSAQIKHLKITHLNTRPHKCSVCGKSYLHACDVKYHMQYVHCKMPWPKRDRSKRTKTVDDKYNDMIME